MRTTTWTWLGIAALALTSGVANAQPQPPHPQGREVPVARPGDPHGQPNDHRPDDHHADDHRPDDHHADDHRPDDHRPGVDDHRPDDRRVIEMREESERNARRRAQYEEMRHRIDVVVAKRPIDEAFRLELRRHAERIARLNRIEFLCQHANDIVSLARARRLEERENARYAAWLNARR